MPRPPPSWSSTSIGASGTRTYTQGERKKRNHRLITRGGAVESIVPEVRNMSERAFFLLMEKVFSLPEVTALVSHATDQQEDG